LRKSSNDRYTSTQQLVSDLERLNAGSHSPASALRLEHTWTPKWRWGVHQLVVTALYLLMLYPAWRVRIWLPQPWGGMFMFLALTCAAVCCDHSAPPLGHDAFLSVLANDPTQPGAIMDPAVTWVFR
jgi:hypothetical protein